MPQIVELNEVPKGSGKGARPGRWRKLCASVPKGKALEITDLIPDGITAREFRNSHGVSPTRYGYSMRIRGERLFLMRKGNGVTENGVTDNV